MMWNMNVSHNFSQYLKKIVRGEQTRALALPFKLEDAQRRAFRFDYLLETEPIISFAKNALPIHGCAISCVETSCHR